MRDFKQLFNSFASVKVGVIGDTMLDTYIWGNVERISPEAPVPVVSLHHKEYRIGGAGNVALNAASLGAQVAMLSITGNDEEGNILQKLLGEKGIDTSGTIQVQGRITTSKTRVIARNQHMLRLDSEITRELSAPEENALIGKIKNFIESQKPGVIIFEDYNKGVLTEKVISETIKLCKSAGIPTAVDPKRKNFFSYKGVDIFKPNLKEVKEGLNLLFDEVNEPMLKMIGESLQRKMEHGISFITLSEKGVYFQKGTTSKIVPSHLRNIADVSGAGDTVIAVAALVYAATKDVQLMAEIANIAGGLVCEEVGTVAIDSDKLLTECETLLNR